MAIVGSVLVSRTEGAVLARSLDEGRLLWSSPIDSTGSGSAVVAQGRTVAVADIERTVGYDLADGHERWRTGGAPTTIGLDGRLVQLDEHVLTVSDDDGEVLGRWRLSDLRGQSPFVVPSDAGVWVMDVNGGLVEVSP
jgi:hypothetical protein